MNRIAEIILDICVGAWLVFVAASIVMILITSGSFATKQPGGNTSVEPCEIQGDHYHNNELYTQEY